MFTRIDEIRSHCLKFVPRSGRESQREHTIPIDIGSDWLSIQQDCQSAAAHKRCEHGLQDCDGDSRFVTKAGHASISGIESRISFRRVRERIISSVEIANIFTELAVARGTSKGLDIAVFVRRNSLLTKLPAYPVCWLCQENPLAHSCSGEGCCAAPQSSSDDDYIYCDFYGRSIAFGGGGNLRVESGGGPESTEFQKTTPLKAA